MAHDRLLDSEVHRLFSHLNQAGTPFGRLPHPDRDRRIPVKPVDDRPEVEPDDIPLPQHSLGRNPVDDLFIYRGTERLWITPIPFKRRPRTTGPNLFLG